MSTNQKLDNSGNTPAFAATATPSVTSLRRRRHLLVLLAVPFLAGAVSLSVARAQGFGGGGGPHDGGRMGAFMEERMDKLLGAVGASEAQRTQIKAVWEPLRPQLQALHKETADLRRQIGQAVAASTIDTARVEQLRRQSVQNMDKTSALMTQGMLASAQVLTPEQRQAVLKKIEERRGHGPGHRGDKGAHNYDK